MAAGGFVGIVSVDLQLPTSSSLKAKRKEVRRLKQSLSRRFSCAVAEVDDQDLWQRTRLTMALVDQTAGGAEDQLEAVARWIHSDPEFVVIGESREVVEACGEGAGTWGSG